MPSNHKSKLIKTTRTLLYLFLSSCLLTSTLQDTMVKVKNSLSRSVDDVSTWQSLSVKSAAVARLDSSIGSSTFSLSTEQFEEKQCGSLSSSPLYNSSSETLTKTIRDILLTSRLSALEACDVKPIPYTEKSFSAYIFSLRGRNLSMILPPLLILVFWDISWQLLFMFLPKGEMHNEIIDGFVSDLQHTIASINSLISKLITPVSFLLTFRLSRAALRFWDARQAAGLMTELCRSNMATAAVGLISPIRLKRRHERRQQMLRQGQDSTNTDFEHGGVEKEVKMKKVAAQSVETIQPKEEDFETEIKLLCEYARWLTLFPIAMKQFLRPGERHGWDNDAYYKKKRFEIGPLLSDDDANQLLLPYENDKGQAVFDTKAKRVREPPLVVLNRLQELSYDIAHFNYGEESEELFQPTPQQRATLYQQLNNQVSTMYKCVGTMERIKTTPLPFVYVIHLRTFLFLYLLLWNMTSMASSGWIALPALLAFNLSMLGIEAASVECECPFDYKPNHLTLGKFCVGIAKNIAQTLKEVRY